MNIYIQCRIFAHVQVKLHERNFKFRQLPRKTINHLKANVGRLYNICLSYFLSEQFAYRIRTNLKNLSFHFGVIDKILQCSNSEQPVLGRKKCRNIFIKIVLLPQVQQVL